MKIAAIVESRLTSRRLPGKNLMPMLGRPMLGRLFDRLKCAKTVDVICLATSLDESDTPLAEFASAEGVACHRGSLEDVLDRVLSAARSTGADLIVEVTGDCPLIDPGIIDAAVRRYLEGGVDYLVNVLDRLSFPIGFDVQIYSSKALEDVARLATDPSDRVNVTPYFYHNADRYRVINLLAPPELDRPRYRLCVDYPEDFALVSAIHEALLPRNPAFTAFDIVRWLDARPDVAAMNIGVPNAFGAPVSKGSIRHETLCIHGS